MEKTKTPFKNSDWTFPYLNNPTSKGYNSLIQTRNRLWGVTISPPWEHSSLNELTLSRLRA
ncbi:hypothetical protein H5410_023383 [Solanum commersonii]|uniref:Uncharacterized protein n=1 Tax=Solanum commersonii TaxID=4109 RepID=A0A9J5ZK15_SOLCO|nr:hypothetical protein H5410_023383 [Solanum commersonii]